MNGISSWFRQFSAKLSAGLRSFMAGRYGTDRLNMVILCAGLFCSLLSVWVKAVPLNIIFWALSDLSHPVPEHLQAVSGKPEISPVFHPLKGQAEPLF